MRNYHVHSVVVPFMDLSCSALFSVLQCFCSGLQCIAVCCSVLQCVAVCCSVLQCAAVCCSVLQYVAVSCSVSRIFLVQRCAVELEPHQKF